MCWQTALGRSGEDGISACALGLGAFPGDNSDPAFGGARTSPEMLREITLDIDQDGKRDRAVLARNDDESSYVDLTIYLGDDADKPDLSRQPSIVKRHLASGHVYEMTPKATDRYASRFAAVGAAMMTILLSASFIAPETFWSAGLSRSWELRDGSIGRCDVNYLTGKGGGVEGAAGAQQGDQDGVQADQACRLVGGENPQGLPAVRPMMPIRQRRPPRSNSIARRELSAASIRRPAPVCRPTQIRHWPKGSNMF